MTSTQLKQSYRAILSPGLALVAAVLLPLTLVLAVVFQPWVRPDSMFLDTQTAAEQIGDCCHIYYGAVSSLGIKIWIFTAAFGLGAALVLYHLGAKWSVFRFPLLGGLLTGWLALDDSYLLHEVAFPTIGVSQNLVLAIYGLLALGYMWTSLKEIFRNDFLILGAAGIGFVASVGIDVIAVTQEPVFVYFEDGAKFIGIFCWMVFHVRAFTSETLSFISSQQQQDTAA